MIRVFLFFLLFSFCSIRAGWASDKDGLTLGEVYAVCQSDTEQCDRIIAGFMQGMEMLWDMVREENYPRKNIFCTLDHPDHLQRIREGFMKLMTEDKKFSDEHMGDSDTVGVMLTVGLRNYLCRPRNAPTPNITNTVDLSLQQMQDMCRKDRKACGEVMLSMMQGMNFETLFLYDDPPNRLYCFENHPEITERMRETFLKNLEGEQDADPDDPAILYMKSVFSPYSCDDGEEK